jgi:hypothetical protein
MNAYTEGLGVADIRPRGSLPSLEDADSMRIPRVRARNTLTSRPALLLRVVAVHIDIPTGGPGNSDRSDRRDVVHESNFCITRDDSTQFF